MTSLPPTSDVLREGLSRLRRAIAQAGEIAGQIERGQATLPLHDHFLGLAAALDAEPFTVIILGSEPGTPVAALAWLWGENPARLPSHTRLPGLLDLHLVSNESPPAQEGNRPSVTGLSQLLAEDPTPPSQPGGSNDSHIVSIPAPQSLQGLRFLVPDTASLDDPVSLARFMVQSNLLILAASGGSGFPSAARWGVQELASHVHVVPIALDPGRPPPQLPAALTDREGMRGFLAGAQHAHRLVAASHLLDDRLSSEIHRMEGRRRTLTRRMTALAGSEQENKIRETSEAVRRVLDAGFGKLETSLTERCRGRVLPTAKGINRIRNLMDDLTPADTAEETAGRTVQLIVHPECIRRITRVVEDQIATDVAGDADLLREGLESLAVEAAGVVAAATGGAVPLRVGWPGEPATNEITGQLDFRQRSELPVRGFLDLMSHGRRPLMVVMMVLSLVGAAFGTGSSLQVWLAPLLLLLFVLSLGWAVVDFRQERRDRLEKELQRLRDALETETRRLYEQSLREWQARASRQLRDGHKILAAQADDLLRGHVVELVRRAADERREIQDKVKVIELRLRELGGLAEQVRRVTQTARETLQTLDRDPRSGGKG